MVLIDLLIFTHKKYFQLKMVTKILKHTSKTFYKLMTYNKVLTPQNTPIKLYHRIKIKKVALLVIII